MKIKHYQKTEGKKRRRIGFREKRVLYVDGHGIILNYLIITYMRKESEKELLNYFAVYL